jgi:hypothetical protein
MHFDKFSFGVLRIGGSTYEQDVVIDCGDSLLTLRTACGSVHVPRKLSSCRYPRMRRQGAGTKRNQNHKGHRAKSGTHLSTPDSFAQAYAYCKQ